MKIVILDAKTLGQDIDLNVFNQFGDVDIYDITSPEQTKERVEDADIIITNKVVINKEVIDSAKKLKLICEAATGYNNIDIEYAKKKGIQVRNVAGYSTESVVQHTFAMLFYLLENLKYYDEYVKNGKYAKSDIFTHLDKPFWHIQGKIWGIVGLGTIGRRVAEVATAFGVKVIYYSTSGIDRPEKYERVSLEKLLSISDIVSIHAPLNDKTKGLLKYEQLKMMKKSAILLNLGRGGIVDEKDLAKAIDEDLIAGAGLDVLEKEPMSLDNPLLKVKNKDKLFITPHIAWTSIQARQTLVNEIVENIRAFLNGIDRNRVA